MQPIMVAENKYAGGTGWGECLFDLAIVYSTLIFIDVCMGEGRTASWRNL